MRIFENSFDPRPYVKPDKVAWASKLLDDDVKAEIEIAAREMESMWQTMERLFQHRGAVRNAREAEVRDPIVKRCSVRTLRALDEQRRRLCFPPGRKPEAWLTHYNGGEVGLESPPWADKGGTP